MTNTNRLATLGALAAAAFMGFAGPAFAQDAKIDTGDTAWMLTSTAIVLMMTIPGVALFYAGMVRKKNVLATMMQSFSITALVTVIWMVVGYSLAFGEGGAFIGDFSRLFLSGMEWDKPFTLGSGDAAVATTIPEPVFMMFQMTFAIITPALICGAFADRFKFSALLWFIGLWSILVYAPVAHWVWHPNGWLFALGALDFAGGTVVHINAGIAGLVAAIVIGKRKGYGTENFSPFNLVLAVIGASLLWVGWFGFNAGSNLEATGVATLAVVNTLLATAAATMSWMIFEWMLKGKPSMLGAASGSIAGLVAITPAAGFVGPMGALIIGLIAGVVCLWGVNSLKRMLGADDALDVFGVHAVGGILGSILTGVFVSPVLGGTGVYDYVANKVGDFDMGTQLVAQFWGVGVGVLWSAVVALIAFKVVDLIIGLRVTEEVEREGLDINEHGEKAYHM